MSAPLIHRQEMNVLPPALKEYHSFVTPKWLLRAEWIFACLYPSYNFGLGDTRMTTLYRCHSLYCLACEEVSEPRLEPGNIFCQMRFGIWGYHECHYFISQLKSGGGGSQDFWCWYCGLYNCISIFESGITKTELGGLGVGLPLLLCVLSYVKKIEKWNK